MFNCVLILEKAIYLCNKGDKKENDTGVNALFCSYCGEIVSEGLNQCPFCGAETK